jgi:rhodanese-related sulfurtransferase
MQMRCAFRRRLGDRKESLMPRMTCPVKGIIPAPKRHGANDSAMREKDIGGAIDMDGIVVKSIDVIQGHGYAGDITPADAWRLLSEDKSAVLVDVRTTAEWSYVGVPDLSQLGKEPLLLQWQVFPSMQVNADFVAALTKNGIGGEQPILFLCRSGVRSKAAAQAMTQAGASRCYNISDGFEGPIDRAGHRGTVAGWKQSNLPWLQK